MRIVIIIIIALAFLGPVAAQPDRIYRINSIGPDSNGLNSSIYEYPQFQKGEVAFINEPLASARLNYNYLSGRLLFISPKGDTLELAKPETLAYVAIGTDTIHYVDKGYAEMLTHYPTVNLYKTQVIKFNGIEKKGPLGTYSGTAASSSINTYSDENINQEITVDENKRYITSVRYYLSDKFYHFLPALKKNFYKLFSDRKKVLTDYLKNNSVHYNNENDLRKLIEYLQSN